MLKFAISPIWLREFAIVRTSGGTIKGDAKCDIQKLESNILAELSERQRLQERKLAASDGLRPPTWLRVTCYQLIQMLYAHDREDEILERIANHKRLRSGTPDLDRNLFKDGLIGLFARHPGAISETDRSRMAKAMWYGFRHYIPPALLAGFNSQYPAHRNPSSDLLKIDPALGGWVKEQRIYSMVRDCNLDQYRGSYPASIKRAVDGAVSKLAYIGQSSGPETIRGTHESDDWD